MSSETLAQNKTATCNECGHSRPIVKPVVKVLGARVGFGPGGSTDMFTEHGGGIVCAECIESSVGEIDIELPVVD